MRPKPSPQTAEGIRHRLAASFLTATVLLLLATTTQAQTLTVLHNFTEGADGGNPQAMSPRMATKAQSGAPGPG